MKAKDIFTIVFFLFVITYCATPNAKDSVITNNIQLIEVKTKSKKKKTKKQKIVEKSQITLDSYLLEYYDISNIIDYSIVEYIALHPFDFKINRLGLLYEIREWLGVPYRYGGKSKKGIDCSSFTRLVVNTSLGEKILNGNSKSQAKQVEKVYDINELSLGDLVFFSRAPGTRLITHVGIYLGNNSFVHASTKYGVIISSIEGYYESRFRFGGKLKI